MSDLEVLQRVYKSWAERSLDPDGLPPELQRSVWTTTISVPKAARRLGLKSAVVKRAVQMGRIPAVEVFVKEKPQLKWVRHWIPIEVIEALEALPAIPVLGRKPRPAPSKPLEALPMRERMQQLRSDRLGRPAKPMSGPALIERLWSNSVETPDGCWLWRGATSSGGYGVIAIAGTQQSVHRVAYVELVGPIPGKHLRQICKKRRCWNPAHLEPVYKVVGPLPSRRCLVCGANISDMHWQAKVCGSYVCIRDRINECNRLRYKNKPEIIKKRQARYYAKLKLAVEVVEGFGVTLETPEPPVDEINKGQWRDIQKGRLAKAVLKDLGITL